MKHDSGTGIMGENKRRGSQRDNGSNIRRVVRI
jgi:hypothetical protein